MDQSDIYEVMFECMGEQYKVQFEEAHYYEFVTNSSDPEYIRNFIPSITDVVPAGERITTKLVAFYDAATGNKIDLTEEYVNDFEESEGDWNDDCDTTRGTSKNEFVISTSKVIGESTAGVRVLSGNRNSASASRQGSEGASTSKVIGESTARVRVLSGNRNSASASRQGSEGASTSKVIGESTAGVRVLSENRNSASASRQGSEGASTSKFIGESTAGVRVLSGNRNYASASRQGSEGASTSKNYEEPTARVRGASGHTVAKTIGDVHMDETCDDLTESFPVALKSTDKRTTRKTKARLNTFLGGDMLDDAEDYLLRLIFDRPILFDYTLPISERSPTSIQREWTDVHTNMNDLIKNMLGDTADNVDVTVDVLKETWLNIRTAYMRYKSGSKKKSGMSPSKVPVIKHLDLLRNYDKVTNKRRTLSNLDDDGEYDDEYAERRTSECLPPKKRGRVNDEFLNVAKKALVSLSSRIENSPNSLPNQTSAPNPTVTATSTSLFAESLSHDLKLLNSHHLASAKMRISQIIFEELHKQEEGQ